MVLLTILLPKCISSINSISTCLKCSRTNICQQGLVGLKGGCSSPTDFGAAKFRLHHDCSTIHPTKPSDAAVWSSIAVMVRRLRHIYIGLPMLLLLVVPSIVVSEWGKLFPTSSSSPFVVVSSNKGAGVFLLTGKPIKVM